MTRRVVVIGADAAGMSAAHQALRAAAEVGRTLHVTALERTEVTSYSACGLPYLVSGDVGTPDELVARTPEAHRAAGIDLRTGTEAVAVDLAARTVTARHEGRDEVLAYDDLVVATGAAPEVPSWALGEDGTLPGGVRVLKTIADGTAWRDDLDGPPRDVVVVGGGYIGLEMAEASARRGHRTTLVTRSALMSSSLDPELADELTGTVRAAGVQVVLGSPVTGLESDGGRVVAVLAGERRVSADLVVLATGVRPATGLVADQLPADLVGPTGGLRADAHGRVAEGLWAAGDCVEVRHRVLGGWARLPLGTHANKLGRALGDALGRGTTDGTSGFPGALGTAITRFEAGSQYVEVACTGISERLAAKAGLDALAVTTRGTTASGYMPEASPVTIRVVAERGTRRLLGVHVLGGRGAAKRVDAAAAVLHFGGTVDDLAWMDLSYAPPFATAWEILQIAARRVGERL